MIQDVLERFQPAMSKEEYLERQLVVFQTELFDGSNHQQAGS